MNVKLVIALRAKTVRFVKHCVWLGYFFQTKKVLLILIIYIEITLEVYIEFVKLYLLKHE